MRRAIWTIILAIAVAYAIYAFTTLDHRADGDVIRSIILDAAQAIQNRDVDGMMASVSGDYKDPARMNYDRLRMIAAQAVRSEFDYTVKTSIDNTKISGDTATALVDVEVKQKNNGSIIYTRSLTIHFTKEPIRHALIIPTKTWRVTSIDNHGLDMGGL